MAEKTPKTKKISDISKPGYGTSASATSRPIVVTNRPLMQDPMMVPGDKDTADQQIMKKPQQITIRPVSDSEEDAATETPLLPLDQSAFDDNDSSNTNADSKSDTKSDAEPESETTSEDSSKDDTSNDNEPQPPTAKKLTVTEPDSEESDSAPNQDVEKSELHNEDDANDSGPEAKKPSLVAVVKKPVIAPLPKPTDTSEDTDSEEKVNESDASERSDEQPNADMLPSSELDTPNALEAAAKQKAVDEAEIAQLEEVQKLLEDKTYFLPIDAVGQRRSKIVSLSGVVLAILLGAVLLVLMLDAGVLSIPGVRPPTDFF